MSIPGIPIDVQQMIDRDPPDVDGAARFCTQLFMGGIPALPEG